MKNSENNVSSALHTNQKSVIAKGVENHEKAAKHFAAASQSHLEAADHHKNENHDKAAMSTIEAQGHSKKAQKAQKKDIKKHTPIC